MTSSLRLVSGCFLSALFALALFVLALATPFSVFAQNDGDAIESKPASQRSEKASSSKKKASVKKAPKKSEKSEKNSSADAVVKTDGTLVYSKPDFDADVITSLKKGDVVRVSKATTGGGYGRFHKVRAGDKIGYVADIDVAVEGASTRAKVKKPVAKKSEVAEASKKSEKPAGERGPKMRNQLPMYFSRYFGIVIGQSGYKESIGGVDANTSLLTYGLKVTGPDVLIAGPVIDFNLTLHYGAPAYYDKLSTAKPSGYILWTDALLPVPFFHSQNAAAYLAAGPLLVLSNIKTITGGNPRDLTALNLGASFVLGGAVRIDKMALRLEAKHFWEKQSYQALQLAVQTEF